MRNHYKAYAKVNVGLKVGQKEKDGFHGIKTYFHLISLADDLYFDIKDNLNTTVSIIGNDSYLEKGKTDLMEKAALLYSKVTSKTFALSIKIDKKIPNGAGLGGGSSDCAVVLLFLEEHYSTNVDLFALALQLGSDVPFFVSKLFAAKGEGRGQILTPITPVKAKALLFMPENIKIVTASAYESLDKRKNVDFSLPSWTTDTESWFSIFSNDFLSIQPLTECKEKCETFRLMLSGSGACYFALYNEKLFSPKLLAEEFKSTKIIGINFLNG